MQIKNIEGLTVPQIKQIVDDGGKFVFFPYTISIVVMTFKRASSIYLVRPDESSFKHSYKHILANGALGWWGIPWGPIYTIGSLYHQLSGGKDVTNEVMSHLIQFDPQGDTTTYNINGMVSSNTAMQSEDRPVYNIPK